ncbi:putative transmembrane protein [Toxoplasma gondii CAST]|uniref:Putative transmembrane protein n=1 Tax=Toxoplasma gondii CAST TaxID=943122 RepID=A0A3R8BYS9_TOXGO|nr:putative transmembrane protein [Toxoplasma gondii CAST]
MEAEPKKKRRQTETEGRERRSHSGQRKGRRGSRRNGEKGGRRSRERRRVLECFCCKLSHRQKRMLEEEGHVDDPYLLRDSWTPLIRFLSFSSIRTFSPSDFFSVLLFLLFHPFSLALLYQLLFRVQSTVKAHPAMFLSVVPGLTTESTKDERTPVSFLYFLPGTLGELELVDRELRLSRGRSRERSFCLLLLSASQDTWSTLSRRR